MTNEIILAVLWATFGSIGAIIGFYVLFGFGALFGKVGALLGLVLGVGAAAFWELVVVVQVISHLFQALSIAINS